MSPSEFCLRRNNAHQLRVPRISTFPTLWAVVEWIESKPWQHPSTCCGGDTTAEHLPLDIVDGFQLSAAALLHTLGLFPPHIVSPFKTDNLNSILDYFRSKPDFVRSSEIIACGYCGVIKKPDSATNDDKQFSQSQGSTDHFVRCGGCLAVNYCSNACAKLDWSNKPGSGGDHKQHCSRITKDPLGDVVATGADL